MKIPVTPPAPPAEASPWPQLSLPLAGLAVGLALAAMALLHVSPPLSFWLFVLAGASLAATAWWRPWDQGLGLWQPRAVERRAWEIPFLLLLAVLTIVPRVTRLDDLPAGAGGHEGEMVGQMLQMDDRKDWVIHVQDADINWPSLVFYQGLAFTKVFGLRPMAYRLSSAAWGILAVLALFFALRALFSPEAAAGGSLMFAGSFYHLVQSRMFFPGTILNFSVIATILFWVLSFRHRSWRWAAVAGAAAGLSLWGFIPGRGVPGLFIIWLLFVAVFAKEHRPSRAQWLAFLAGGVLVAGPVIYYALRYPDFYWGYVSSMNPNRGHGLGGYLHTLITESGPYFKVFHLTGDVDAGMSPPLQPMLDPIAGLLFPLGLFAAVALFWRPVNALIIGVFLAGMMPAVMGTGFAHPTTRRMVLAWPAVFMFAALAFEQLRRALNPEGSKRRDLWLGLAFVALAGVSYAQNVRRYFTGFYTDPTVISHIAHDDYRLFKDHQDAPGMALASSQIYSGVVWSFYFPRQSSAPLFEPEDVLRLSTDAGTDAYVDPVYAGAAGFLRAALPDAKVEVVPSPFYPEVQVSRDPFVPQYLYMRVRIPAGAFAKARGMEQDGKRVDVMAGSFGESAHGQALRLRGMLVVPRLRSIAKLTLAWPGFTLRLDGRPLGNGQAIQLEGGIHELAVEGRAPAAASGPLPLTVSIENQSSPLVVYPLRWAYGVVATYYNGTHAWKTPPRFSRRWAASVYRFQDIGEVFLPFSVRMQARLLPPVTGDYRFADEQWGQLRIDADGKTAFDDIPGETKTAQTLRLVAGKPVKLDILHEGFPGGSLNRAFLPLWVKPGGQAPEPIPATALETPAWEPWKPAPAAPRARP